MTIRLHSARAATQGSNHNIKRAIWLEPYPKRTSPGGSRYATSTRKIPETTRSRLASSRGHHTRDNRISQSINNKNQAIQGSNQISRESSSRFRVNHNQPKKNPDTKPLENLVSSKTHHHITFLIKNPFGSPRFVTKSHGFINHTSEYSLTFELELQNLDNLSRINRKVVNKMVIRVIKW